MEFIGAKGGLLRSIFGSKLTFSAVDDESVFKVLSKELSKPKYKNGVVVDGFPRTTQQAEWLASLHQRLSANKYVYRYNISAKHLSGVQCVLCAIKGQDQDV